jgi:hypothetical protein
MVSKILQNCDTTQILVFGGRVRQRESFNAWELLFGSKYYTILNHIETMVTLPLYENPCMLYRLDWYWYQKYRQILLVPSYW